MKRIICFMFFILFFVSSANANDNKKEDAKNLAESANSYLKVVGEKKAFKAFNDSKGVFVKDNLYVFVFDFQGVCWSHGADKNLIGKNLYNAPDVNGKLFIQDFIKLAKVKGRGWVDYVWVLPKTKQLAKKSSYIIKISDDKFLGVGVYLE